MANYKDYGYNGTGLGHVHGYLTQPLLAQLDPAKNRCILDMGCGNGSLTRVLLERGFDCYGVDASESGIAIANEQHPGRFALMDFSSDDLPESFRGKAFDTLISTEVIEHLYDPRRFIRTCKALLPPGGELILSTPYHGYLKNLFLALAGRWDQHQNPLWDGGHIKLWSRATLSRLLEEEGFRVTAFAGCGRIPYLWKSMIVKGELRDA